MIYRRLQSQSLNNKEEALFENLANIWQQLGRQPVGKDLDKAKAAGNSKFSLGTYEKRFGSWNKALQAFIDYINESSENKNIVVESTQIKQKTGRLVFSKQYRISTHQDFVRFDRNNLLKHADSTVKALAKRFPKRWEFVK
ncbi:MAG: hypothetical protein WC335_03945 [Candidatus Omnitrophota bacterium]|jgi:hypothetical protein